jgi:hypothetical protein
MAEDGWTPLSHEILCKSLSLIDKTVEGSGYVFTKLDCSEKELTHLGNKVQDYKHLKYVTLSKNQIEDLAPVSQLPHCLCLVASENKITKDGIKCMTEADLPFCQVMDLSINQLAGVFTFNTLPKLRILDLKENQIASLEGFDGHPNIEILKLEKNQLETLKGLGSLPKLQKLFLSENKLTSLEGLDAETIEELDVSQNQLTTMEFQTPDEVKDDGLRCFAPNIRTLNITANQFAGDDDLPEFSKAASALPVLETILVASNPLCDTFPDPRKEILLVAPGLQKIDEQKVDNEEREACVQLMKVRAVEITKEEKKGLGNQLAELLEQMKGQGEAAEKAAATIEEKQTKNADDIAAEFPPPAPPAEGDDADAEVEKPDPMPKLLKEIEQLKELMAEATTAAKAAGVGLEAEAPPADPDA